MNFFFQIITFQRKVKPNNRFTVFCICKFADKMSYISLFLQQVHKHIFNCRLNVENLQFFMIIFK